MNQKKKKTKGRKKRREIMKQKTHHCVHQIVGCVKINWKIFTLFVVTSSSINKKHNQLWIVRMNELEQNGIWCFDSLQSLEEMDGRISRNGHSESIFVDVYSKYLPLLYNSFMQHDFCLKSTHLYKIKYNFACTLKPNLSRSLIFVL